MDQCLLPNPTLARVYEILWCCYTIPWSACVCRFAVCLPGSETALEEEGVVAKIADDLYYGGNSPKDLVQNFRRVLKSLYEGDFRLSACKTIINLHSTTLQGWTWNSGMLPAGPYRIAALTSCPAPDTVSQMKSFIGVFKMFSRVIQVVPRSSSLSTMPLLAVSPKNPSSGMMTSRPRSIMQAALSSARTIRPLKANEQL